MNENQKTEEMLASDDQIGNDAAQDLRYMRSVIEKTQRAIDPGASMIIVWGLMCLVGYCTTHFLIAAEMTHKINTLWFTLYGVCFPLSWFLGYRYSRHEQIKGAVSKISQQIGMIWGIMCINGIIWGNFHFGGGVLFNNINFAWSFIYATALTMMGVVYSKEWLYAGLGVFASMMVAAVFRDYTYLILGVGVGGGCVIPSLIAMRRVRLAEKADEHD